MTVAFPHISVRDCIDRKPFRPHLITLHWAPAELSSAKYVHFKYGPALLLELEFKDPVFYKPRRFHASLFPELPRSPLCKRFTFRELPPESIPAPRAESTLFHPQEKVP